MSHKKNKFLGRYRVCLIAVAALFFLSSLILGQSALALDGTPALTVSGTLTDGANEQEVKDGNQTIVLTLENATFAEDVVTDAAKLDALLAGLAAGRLYQEVYAGTGLLTGDPSTYDAVLASLESKGWTTAADQTEWGEVISAIKADLANIALSGDRTQVTITIPAVTGYDPLFTQTIKATIPDELLVGAGVTGDLTAVKPFVIDAVLGTLSWNGQNENDITTGGKVITLTTTWPGGFANKVGTLTSAGGKQTAFIDYFEAQSETSQWAKVKSSLYESAAVVRAGDGKSVTITLLSVANYDITDAQQIRYYFATGLTGQTGGGGGGSGASFPIAIAVPMITIDAAAPSDTTAPSMSSADPEDQATGVAIGKTIAITFSEAILASDTYDQISLKDGSNNEVTLTKSIIDNTLTLDPVSDLGCSTTYTVTVPASAVEDAAGNGLTGTYTMSFTTASAPKDECFIATAAFGSKFQPSVALLRHFRDQFLLTNSLGKAFVAFYYRNSPPIAHFIAGSEVLKTIVRVLLIPFIVFAYLMMHPLLGYPVAAIILYLLAALVLRKRRMAFSN